MNASMHSECYLPPTVAPMRATSNNTGMFMLKIDWVASEVSAMASKGVANNNALLIPTNPIPIPNFYQMMNMK